MTPTFLLLLSLLTPSLAQSPGDFGTLNDTANCLPDPFRCGNRCGGMSCLTSDNCWGPLECLHDISYPDDPSKTICTMKPQGFVYGYIVTGVFLGGIVLIGFLIGVITTVFDKSEVEKERRYQEVP